MSEWTEPSQRPSTIDTQHVLRLVSTYTHTHTHSVLRPLTPSMYYVLCLHTHTHIHTAFFDHWHPACTTSCVYTHIRADRCVMWHHVTVCVCVCLSVCLCVCVVRCWWRTYKTTHVPSVSQSTALSTVNTRTTWHHNHNHCMHFISYTATGHASTV